MTDDIAGIELAYNIVEALRRYADHSDCQLFSALLVGQVQPAVWFDRVALVDKLRVSHAIQDVLEMRCGQHILLFCMMIFFVLRVR